MANQKLIKNINRARVLNTIRMDAPIPRSAIADALGLDRKSVTNVVGELIAEGLVHESGTVRAGKGRPLTMLSFAPGAAPVLGLALEENGVTGVAVSLSGDVVFREAIPFAEQSPLPVIRETIGEVYRAAKSRTGGRLRSIGLSAPGIIDTDSGMVLNSVNLQAMNGTNVLDLLRSIVSEPVILEEKCRVKALAEKWFGLGQGVSNFVCIDLGIGIGAGIVQNRRLRSEGMAYAGEIGHVIIEKGGRPCRCGHRGCLEAYLSERVLLRELNIVSDRRWHDLGQYRDPGPAAAAVLADAGHRLGLALSHLVNIICPPIIVLNGNLMAQAETVMPSVLAGAAEGSLPTCLARVRILPSEFADAAAVGAAARALAELFEVEDHFYV